MLVRTALIFPPFRECPSCHEMEFGVFGVNPTHAIRHCRACGHAALVDLPTPRKQIIYLDQWAWSKMLIALQRVQAGETLNEHQTFFRDLYLQLDRLVKLMLIVCPHAPVHTVESLGLIRADASGQPTHPTDAVVHERMFRLIGLLSGGIKFEHELRIISRQVSAAAQAWLRGEPMPALERDDALYGHVDAWLPLLYGSLDRGVSSEELVARASSLSVFNRNFATVVDCWRSDDPANYRVWFDQELTGHSRMIKNAYAAHAETIAYLRRRIDSRMGSSQPLVNLLLGILDAIIEREGATLETAQRRADELFASDHLRQTPIVRISCALWAGFAHRIVRGGATPPGQGVGHDTTFISAYLPYCDVMLTDDECAHVLTHAPAARDIPEGTRVYSARTRHELMAYLARLEATASDDLRRVVADVYGDDWDRPDLSTFF